ncbi:MAG: hypothetical protein U9O94_01290 [Nanoarchaeota archaeon]|nr:hypothetical protein [Nanoarchaeota archaeon]
MNQEIVKIEQERKGIAEQVNALSIVNQTTYEQGASMKLSLSTFRKKIDIFFKPMVTKSKAAYDEVRGTRDDQLKPVKDLEDVVKNKIKGYENEMRLKQEEADRKAEEEKQRKLDEENKRRQSEAEQKAKDEAEVLGVDEKEVEVEKIEEATVEDIEVEQPLPEIDRVVGLGIRRTWSAKIVDKSKIPLEYLIPDQTRLNALARAEKDKFNVPGVEAIHE